MRFRSSAASWGQPSRTLSGRLEQHPQPSSWAYLPSGAVEIATLFRLRSSAGDSGGFLLGIDILWCLCDVLLMIMIPLGRIFAAGGSLRASNTGAEVVMVGSSVEATRTV